MWGQTISPGSPPFKSHMYICCIYLFCIVLSFLHRRKKSFLFLPKGRAFVTMSNVRNIRISDGCVYAQIRKGLGMHMVTYTNHDTVPFLLLVQYKGGLSEIEFTVSLFSNACMIFFTFLEDLVHFSLYKGWNRQFLLGVIIKLP